jgi:hypothetical protein
MNYIVIYAKRYENSKIHEVRRQFLYYLFISNRIYITLL